MSDQIARRDENRQTTITGITDDSAQEIRNAIIDPVTNGLKIAVVGGNFGVASINTDTTENQTLTVGTSGSDFNIVDDGAGDHEFNLPTASSTKRGALSTVDWQTFNSKLTPNSPIVAATKTKITYDANGLVTTGADATTDDIADSFNKRYVTDSDLINLSNLSGTNTGDQNLSGYQLTSEKDVAGGYVGLDGSSKINPAYLPAGTLATTYTVASEAAMLALSGAVTGDVAIRTDVYKTFILQGSDPSVLGDWAELLSPTAAVTSVFSRTGAVTAQNNDYDTSQVPDTTDKRYVTDADLVILSNTSGINTGDITNSNGTEIDAAIEDTHFVTSKALADSHNVANAVPGTSGNILVSDGTDWLSQAPTFIPKITSTDNNIPQWNGTGGLLKDGLAVGTSASNLVQLDGSAKLPAVDGSQLTNLPLSTNNYKAKVRNSGQNLTSGSSNTVALDTESYDPNGNFNTSTYGYSCPVTGYYLVTARCYVYNSGGKITKLQILVDGTNITEVQDYYNAGTSINNATLSSSEVAYCTAGTVMYLKVTPTTSDSSISQGYSVFSVHLLSQ